MGEQNFFFCECSIQEPCVLGRSNPMSALSAQKIGIFQCLRDLAFLVVPGSVVSINRECLKINFGKFGNVSETLSIWSSCDRFRVS